MDTLIPLHPALAAWLRQSDLFEFVPTYWQYLVRRRYAASTRRVYLSCVAHFARWLTQQGRSACDISNDAIRRFLDRHLPHCSCPQPVRRYRKDVRAALRHLLVVLCDAGVAAKDQVSNAIEEELCRFDDYMHHNRGLSSNTRAQRLRILRAFLVETSGPHPIELTRVSAGDLRRFIDQTLQRWSPESAQVLAGTLRSYLRFRALFGDQVDHLLPAITSPASWRLSSLPKVLSPTEVAQLLAPFPSEVPSVHRAYAMVRCLVDLGLRASEVVGLDLDDIDWCAGTIRIGPSKSRRVDVLPLPQPTGSAIATYLCSERPRTNNHRVFVRHVAPVGEPIGPGVVRRAVREAFRRCGLPYTRVHILRHTLAGRLLKGGATLKEVSDLLRHRALDTTLIYAKIDSNRLATVALPWPGRAS
ncbi:MAG: tyrosine-type recombinase/integrase [Candidatus Rokuibacteriota bacterium]